MLFDDLSAHPQSETGPDRILRGKERLKDVVPNTWRNAFAVVSDCDSNPVFTPEIRNLIMPSSSMASRLLETKFEKT